MLAHIKEKTCDFQGAKEAYRRSFALDANYPTTRSSYGIFLSALGEHNKAVKEILLAQELDPFSALINSAPLICLYYARRYAESIRHWERITELELIFPAAGSFGGLAYVQTKRYQEAIKIFRQAVENSNRSNTALVCLGHALAVWGERVEANKILKELLELSKTRYVSSYGIALVYVGLGEKDRAIESLVAANEERNLEIIFLNVEPRFDPLRDDPRFQEIIGRIGFPPDETNQTDESLEAKTMMLSTGEVISEPPAKDSETENAETKPTTESTTNPKSEIQKPKSKWWLFGLLSLLVLIGGFFGYKYLSPTTKQINSIAVLPFENKSSDADTDYLSDGLAESLIYRLSQIPDLKVSPTSSVFRYKGKATDPQVVAKELGVDSVMTGRITQRGDNLTISVNLVDTRNGKSLWGEQYERKMSELLTTQREIASEITKKLQLKLSGAGEQKLTKKYTDNNEAYQLYLKGRFYWNKRDEENIRKAIEQFKAAADLDPNYALAFVGLADCYMVLPYFSSVASTEVLPQAKTYVTRAIEIDDSLGEAHASLGYYFHQSWNWAESEKSFKRSIELNPTYASAHRWFALYLETVGRYDEAEIEFKQAQELEPLSLIVYSNLAEFYTRKGNLKVAAEQCQRAIELDPNWHNVRFSLALVYLKQGRNAEAIAESEKSVELSKRQSIPLGVLGYVYAKAGRQTDAIKIVEELKERHQKQQADGLDIARVYGGLGETDQAFVWLDKEFQSRNQKLPIWLALGWFDSPRDDPRYKDLLKRMGLPE